MAAAKQALGGIEYGTVTVTPSANVDLKSVYKRNNIAYLCIHGTAGEELYANGTAHFQTSISPPGDTYIPYFIQNGASSRVQLALVNSNGLITLIGGDQIGIGETFLFYTQFLLG